ncbi:MAG: glutathione S-transferase family protein [Alphaproteobacteria bacterium]
MIFYHFSLDPACRLIRLLLAEKGMPEPEMREERYWERNPRLLALNPASEVPVLRLGDGSALSGVWPIVEYIEETGPAPSLLPDSPVARGEARRLTDWFMRIFANDVSGLLLRERVLTRVIPGQSPDTASLRAGLSNIELHLEYISWLTERRRWLAGDQMTLADLAAAAALSAVDYAGDVPWKDHPDARDYYARLKSRPSMRPLLAERLSGVQPARHYAELDFE